MGPKEKEALLALESFCRGREAQFKSILLSMHLSKIARARIADEIDFDAVTQLWEKGELGLDENYVKVVPLKI